MAKYGVFLKKAIPDRMVVVKTTIATPADSDWDSQNGEVDFKGDNVLSIWSFEHDSNIYIATQQQSGRVAFHLFDPGTDTWTTKNQTVAVAGDTDFDNAPDNHAVTMSVRANGTIVIIAAYNDGTNERLRVFKRETGEIFGWGINSVGQVGDNTTSIRSSPVQVGSLVDWIFVTPGSSHALALKKDRTLWAWGSSGNGRLGDGQDSVNFSSPIQIGALTDWDFIASGGTFSVAIKDDGTLWAWGDAASGRLGNNTVTPDISSPIQIGSLTDWKTLGTKGSHTLAIKDDGTLWAWGFNGSGRLGDGTAVSRSSPVQIGALTNWAQISGGGNHSLAVKADGTLWAWGLGSSGQLGDSSTTAKSSPIQIGSLTNWRLVICGDGHSLAVKKDGTLWAWGDGTSGQLGDETSTSKSSPVQIGLQSNWLRVAAGSFHSFAIKTDGTLWAWGNAGSGRLGNGTTGPNISSPIQIGSLTMWAFAPGGNQFSQALRFPGWTNEGEASGGIASTDYAGVVAFPPAGDDRISWAFGDITNVDVDLRSLNVSPINNFLSTWGNPANGQLGNGTTTPIISSPIQIGPLVDWDQMDVGDSHVLAVKDDGTLWVWGNAGSGRLGNNTVTPDISSPIQIGALTDWASVYSGAAHSHAVKDDGTLWAWGLAASGQLGDGTTTDKSSPVQIGLLTDWISTSNSDFHTLALKDDGTLWAWGRASSGQLGDGTTTDKSSPVQIGSDTDWTFISAGNSFSHAVKTGGTLWAWGIAGLGQLGNGTTDNKSSPVQIGSLTDWASVSGGDVHALATKTDGTLWAWGFNSSGRLGDGTTTIRSSPVQIGSLTDWASVSAGIAHSLAIKNDRTLWAWGDNSPDGQLGDGTTTDKSSPVQIGILTDWDVVGAGNFFSAAFHKTSLSAVTEIDPSADSATLVVAPGVIDSADKIYLPYIDQNTDKISLFAWGDNSPDGRLGDGTIIDRSSPVQIGSLEDWGNITASTSHSHAIKTDGTLWAWGDAANGRLGNGTTTPDISSPVQIGALTDWSSVSAGIDHSLAVKDDGTLWAWGIAGNGRLGNETTTPDISSPIQIGSLTDWVDTDAGNTHSLAIKTDGTLWAWGNAANGRLGDGTTVDKSSPVQIGSLTDWASVSGGSAHSLAVKNDGTLWAWGNAPSGELGDSSTTSKSSPVQIGALTDWGEVAAGSAFSIAIKTDGTLWAWGGAAFGRLGNGTAGPNISSPVQIGALTDWASMSTTASHSLAVKTDGTLWAWGAGISGQLGNGTTDNKSSPVQIGSLTSWIEVSAGASHSFGLSGEGPGKLSIASWTSGPTPTVALDTTLTARDVFGTLRTSPAYAAACMALEGTTNAHLVYYDDVDRDIYHEDDVDGAVGSDTLIEDLTDTITGQLWDWGFAADGRLGNETVTPDISVPVQLGSLADWTEISGGFGHSLAVKTDGTLWAWGIAGNGRLGNETTTPNISSPIQIGALADWADVSVGNQHSLAIKSDGTLWAWGDASDGRLGDGTTVTKSSPVQIGALTDWANVSAGNGFSTAIKTDGTIWAWGIASSGQLGDGTSTAKSSPVQIGSLTTWASIEAGSVHAHAIKDDGTLWAWGEAGAGRLGNSTTTPAISSPVQIGSLTDWLRIATGDFHSIVVKTDGSLWAWGDNSADGELGDGTTTDRSSPVQIGSLTDWMLVSAGANHSLALKNDNTLWAWGRGANGRLGDGTVVSKSSPVQISALINWSSISAGSSHSLAIEINNDHRISARVIA